MRLDTEFIKLPLRFDVDRLVEEVTAFPEEAWIGHPTGYEGNAALILVSVGGTINDDFALGGQMAPTPYLDQCPYLKQVLVALNTPISRSRLMLLAPGAEVPMHNDVSYHWYHRTRIHVPIITHPEISFHCDEKAVHMAPGETWIFDNFRMHKVVNQTNVTRIHLVADTMGSPEFWALAGRGHRVFDPAAGPAAPARFVPYQPGLEVTVPIETYRFELLTPAEVESLVSDVREQVRKSVDPGQVGEVEASLDRFCADWRALFEAHGHDREALPAYREVFDRTFLAPAGEWLQQFPRTPNRGYQAVRVLGGVFAKSNRRTSTWVDEVSLAALRNPVLKAARGEQGG